MCWKLNILDYQRNQRKHLRYLTRSCESTVNKRYEFYLLFYFGINIKMTEYQNLKVKLSDSQLDKLKSATKKRLV